MTSPTLHPPCPACGDRLRRPDGHCAQCGLPSQDSAASRAPLPVAPPGGEDRPVAPDPLIGQLVGGRFRVEALLGEGGMGRVFKAVQVELARPVALKVLHASLTGAEAQKARFHREALAASRLTHPHSVVVHDFGEWQGQLFIAMEYLEGRTLSALLDAEWPLAPPRIVHLLGQVCDALAAAHRQGVLHRDLKPDNIIVQTGADGSEQVKVVDFGLATLQEREGGSRLTQEGVVTGTPAYMSPEQCRGRGLDHRSDLYALGVILYEMLSGDVPFSGDAPVEVLVQHLFTPPRPPAAAAPEVLVDPRLEALALVALSKSPQERPADALDFRERLRGALSPAPATRRDVGALRPLLSRADRADAAGLPRSPAPTRLERPALPAEDPVLVLETAPHLPASLTTLLLACGEAPLPIADLPAAATAVAHLSPLAVVVDLSDAPPGTLAALTAALGPSGLAGAPVVVVGDGDDLPLVTRALQAGVTHFVPHPARVEKLPALLERLRRKARRQRARAREAADRDPSSGS